MARTRKAKTSPEVDQKAAQIIARSFFKMQHGADATDAAWDAHKAEFYRIAQQTVATLNGRGFSISDNN